MQHSRIGRATCRRRIVIPPVTTLTTLADVRVLMENLPEHHRDSVWRRIRAQLEQAAAGST
jgi:hypothetical protein